MKYDWIKKNFWINTHVKSTKLHSTLQTWKNGSPIGLYYHGLLLDDQKTTIVHHTELLGKLASYWVKIQYKLIVFESLDENMACPTSYKSKSIKFEVSLVENEVVRWLCLDAHKWVFNNVFARVLDIPHFLHK